MSDSSASWKPTVSRSAAYGRERVIQEDLDLPPATQSYFYRSWPSYFRFAEERPSDIAVTGSPRGHSFAASYAYDPVHPGQLFLMTLGWDDYSGARHQHERQEVCDAWLKTVKHWYQPIRAREGIIYALEHPYWRSRRSDILYQQATELCRILADLGARRYPVAEAFACQLQMLYSYEMLRRPPHYFIPAHQPFPFDFATLYSVELTHVGSNDTAPKYRMTDPPPFYPHTKKNPLLPNVMTAWFIHATTLLKAENIPSDPDATEFLVQANRMITDLRAQSNPILGSLTRWIPSVWSSPLFFREPPKCD